MSIQHRGNDVSGRVLRRSFALACAALFLSASSTTAGTVLQFAQLNANDVVTATDTAGVTTLSTAGNVDGFGTAIPVVVSTFNGAPFLPIPVYETYVGVTSVGPATISLGGTISQLFSGTIVFSEGTPPGVVSPILLTATFTNAVFSGSTTAASLIISAPNLTLTSDFATFPANTGMAIDFTGLAPPLSIASDGSVASFEAQNAGSFSAGPAVPEPSSLCLASIAAVIGTLAAYGRTRMQRESAS